MEKCRFCVTIPALVAKAWVSCLPGLGRRVRIPDVCYQETSFSDLRMEDGIADSSHQHYDHMIKY